jgi:hypothetical protein
MLACRPHGAEKASPAQLLLLFDPGGGGSSSCEVLSFGGACYCLAGRDLRVCKQCVALISLCCMCVRGGVVVLEGYSFGCMWSC